ncbi:EthD family reductase [Bradyrhizobium sp. U87765 SZCCT0131]|uniref:EthD family reductase n=1 Tax=unclassified Bradyrhizobium TaxID=2631580 RepID=UPI001BA8D611|nr:MULTISPECIES: EthD family reductase [unclassified Bradyrhizobium]MBR1220722.1 EthD family reductase [Bradyrhizobium sp. U87765 SZCCT0131]MBR1260458.1 EthD family reductase [Bradyrhizobium sp. U87765 SZCCT0134]MBR1307293.1 EthD family reductase [Bradyrhizobium sp. U87765 SZCCT0110]MBR1321247.1 EthD family reductase [Bradyrhizobium sp. U87765 SZCCT0109]MBR1349560.1 EthD family reductase [Bradyrhizobium sp. U87765 SZCCT0048]
MIKRISILSRKDGIDDATFDRRWLVEHAAIVRRVPGVAGYVQNRVASGPAGGTIDGIAELWFADAATMDRVLASSDWQAVVADAREFVAGVTSLAVEEHTVVAPAQTRH